MRQKLNENPVVQVVMLGFLGIIVAFLFMTRVMQQADEPPATTAATTPAATAPSTTPTTSAPAPEGTVGALATPAAPAAPESAGFKAGPGLPGPMVDAYESGDVVVLLVVQEKGIEDKSVETGVEALRSRGDTSVFVTDVKDVARYSRIAQGVDLDRAPALVAIHPRNQAQGELPVASVSYGFRGPDGIEQAVRDALYDGEQLPYHPG